MGQLLHEVNDSVYFIAGEGFFVHLNTDDYNGYYGLEGIECLLVEAINKGLDTTVLDSALSILRSYKFRMDSSGQLFIPAKGGIF